MQNKRKLSCYVALVYNSSVGFPTIVINALCNRLYGPGGGTRRLHQKNQGGEIGLTLTQRQRLCSVLYHRYRTIFINANDNRLAIAA